MNLKETLKEILSILENVNEREWIPVFSNFVIDIEIMHPKDFERRVLKIYGGMGSFNDLVLYNKGNLCFEENVKLDQLRKKLYEEITDKIKRR